MRVERDYRDIGRAGGRRRVVTVGNFDGVHVGHRAVLAKAARLAAERELELAVLTFEPHPAEVLDPTAAARRLTEPERKLELLAAKDVELVLAQRFDSAFARLDPERFAREVLAEALVAEIVIVGDNFRFGAGRTGDVQRLRELGAACGFEVAAHDLVSGDGRCISSSRIRDLVAAGDVAAAARLLGRPHRVAGTVVHGKGDGRRLGFPTANLDHIRVLLPSGGIFAARCRIGARRGAAAVYVGQRPTLGHGDSVEAHLVDWSGDLYGRRLELDLVDRVREDRRFAGVEQLVAQMGRDVARARELLERADG